MAAIGKDKLQNIKKHYANGLSAREIAEIFGVSIHAVYYFLRKHNIERRGSVEAKAASYKRQLPTYELKERLTEWENQLKLAGVMLYWAEGSKWDGERIVDFANSNPEMIKIFLSFLRIVCGVREDKLRIYLYCYENHDVEALQKYWSNITGIPLKQFTKPFVRKDFNLKKLNKMPYGMIHVRYADKKLLDLIRSWIEEYSLKYSK
jgi:predicted DNA-binding protein YlxM (UPF0122 family)